MICTCFVLFAIVLKGQNTYSFASAKDNFENCLLGYSYYEDNINASIVVDNILSKMKLTNTYFITKVCRGLNNAYATKYNGYNYILLDVTWMENLKFGINDWFHLFVIGHEITHHLLHHLDQETTSLQQSRQQELDCDEFAGYILGIYGAPESEISTLLLNFPEDNNVNSTHPVKKDRIAAIQKGYNKAQNLQTNILLQSISKSADFNLSNVPYLVNQARNSYSTYLKSGDKNSLLKAIEYYQEAIRFYDETQVKQELSSMFLIIGNSEKYFQTLEYIYESTKNAAYLGELLGSSISLNYNTSNYISKYGKIVDQINPSSLNDIHNLISVSRYFRHMAGKNQDEYGNCSIFYLNKAEESLSLSLKMIEEKPKMIESDYNCRAETYNELGLCESMQDNYESALEYFKKAESDFMYGAKIGDGLQENSACYFSRNILTVYCNCALMYVRLRDWELGLQKAELYESTYSNLSISKKTYLKNVHGFNEKEIYYIKGRCCHGLGRYEDAIEYYTIVIQDENRKVSPGSPYYYRGLSFIGLGKTNEACSDFQRGCELGISPSCIRYNTTCK